MMTGLGGDLFVTYWDAKTGKLTGLNSSGAAPIDLSPEFRFRERREAFSCPLKHFKIVSRRGLGLSAERYRRGPRVSVSDPGEPKAEESSDSEPLLPGLSWNSTLVT
jgi:hypothetical protein